MKPFLTLPIPEQLEMTARRRLLAYLRMKNNRVTASGVERIEKQLAALGWAEVGILEDVRVFSSSCQYAIGLDDNGIGGYNVIPLGPVKVLESLPFEDTLKPEFTGKGYGLNSACLSTSISLAGVRGLFKGTRFPFMWSITPPEIIDHESGFMLITNPERTGVVIDVYRCSNTKTAIEFLGQPKYLSPDYPVMENV